MKAATAELLQVDIVYTLPVICCRTPGEDEKVGFLQNYFRQVLGYLVLGYLVLGIRLLSVVWCGVVW